jgi:hypothetical protein
MSSTIFLLILFFFSAQLTSADVNYVCDWKDGEPVLYHEYHTDVCPAPNSLLPDGRCEPRIIKEGSPGNCDSFCQMRTNFYYGPEIPLQDAYCHGPGSCTVSSNRRVGGTWKLKVNPNLNVGVLKGKSSRNLNANPPPP